MPGIRELLAVILGVLFGIILIVAPRVALQLSIFVGPKRRRRGDYGSDNHESFSDQWAWLIRGLGVACLVSALFIAYQTCA
jgi:hypothetical protein